MGMQDLSFGDCRFAISEWYLWQTSSYGNEMKKNIGKFLIIGLVSLLIYLLAWPVPVDPVPWTTPPNPGYTGAFAPNERLANLETLPIGSNHGPEDIALDRTGRIYAATREGWIVRLDADGSNPQHWAQTDGRPLGMEFDGQGNLIVADAYRGLLSIRPDARVAVVTDEADGIPIRYADDVDVAADGKIYFSDASTKFGAMEFGGTYPASLLDLMEHGGHGRLLMYDPATGVTTTLLDGINFANGVAVSHDQSFVLVNETGEYRVLRYWISGPRKGQSEPLIEALPSFPDNISTGLEGRFWVALVSPRDRAFDELSDSPLGRKIVQRLPEFFRPKAVAYGHVIAINAAGEVLENLQDPSGSYPINTTAVESEEYLYIGSLVAPNIARMPY
jgi:sugar lactone lactonase YvrE